MNQHAEHPDHEAVSQLLPWYVNQTLNANERAAVAQHLDGCEECRKDVELLASMRDTVQSQVPAPIVPRPKTAALLEAVDRHDARIGASHWISPRAVAAVLAIAMIGAVVIATRLDPGEPGPNQFETATGSSTLVTAGYILAIEFEPGTEPTTRDDVISALGGSNLGTGSEPNTYRIAVSVAAGTLEDLANYTRKIEANENVVGVKLVAVQLPVE